MPERTRPPVATSLRQRLLRGLLLPVLIGAPAALWWQSRAVQAPVQEAFDQALADAAIALSTFVKTDAAGRVLFELDPLAERALRTDQFDSVSYAVLGPGGVRIAGDAPLAQGAPALAPEAWRYDDAQVDGVGLRVVRRGVPCAACTRRVAPPPC